MRLPSSSIRRVTPVGSRISSVRGLTASAFEWIDGSRSRSMTRGCLPARTRNNAAASPTGPAPTTSGELTASPVVACQPPRWLIRSGFGAEPDGKPVPSVDGDDRECQIDELLVGKVSANLLVYVVRRVGVR